MRLFSRPFAFVRWQNARTARPVSVASRRRTAKRAVIAGLACFLLLSLGLGVTSEAYPRIRDPFYGDKLVKLQPKLGTAPLVVMLGTSRTGFGFHGIHIEDTVLRETGRPIAAFNYGIPASGPITHLIYLKRLIEDGATPDLLVLEILPSMLANANTGPLERYWVFGERLTHREIPLVVKYGFDEAEVTARWRGATFNPWYALRFQLLGRVVQSWIPWQCRFDWSRGTDRCGWGTPLRDFSTPEERAIGAIHAKNEYFAVLHNLQPNGHAVAALRELLRVCNERGITVKLLQMPESVEFRSWYSPEVNRRLTSLYADLNREYGCEMILASDWVPDDQFTDGHHLLRPGAERFSERLARDVLIPWHAKNAKRGAR